MQQKVNPLPKTEGAMKAFAIDHGSKRSFVSLFKDVTNAKENIKEEEYSMWSKLPLDLQISIIQCISPNGRDYRNLRGVCRRWKALAPPLRWISGPAATRYPWLVSFDQERKGVYDLYDPASDLSYHMSSTESPVSYPVIFASSNGWLLLSQGPQSVSMLEPFTKTRIDLPKMPQRFNLVGGHFFAVDPTSREYLVGKIFRHSPEKLVILGFGSDMTSCACFSVDNKSFTPSRNNLICGRWHIFGLDQNGRLGRLQMIGNPRHWHVLNESQLLCFPSSASKRFLVASNRGLMSVFVGSSAEWVEVFEFNFSSREWEQVDSLPGNLVLFVGQTSIAVEAEEERMRNKIFFPIFKEADGSIMFYSLETRRFRSFSSEDSYSSLDLHGFRELSNCTWIRPRLVPEKILFTEPSVNKVLRSQLRPSLLDGPDVNETFPALSRRKLFPKKVSLTSGQSKTLLDGRDSFPP